MNPAIKRSYERWYPLKEHPVQMELVHAIDNGVRFPLVPAGRRSGKTERFKRFLAKTVMSKEAKIGNYFAAAPTHNQAQKIFWDDLKLFTFASTHKNKPSETDKIIFMPNGCKVHVLGLDKPERFEGIPWLGGGIDEIANVKTKSVNENIMPALDTENPTYEGYLAWCWFLGVPDGLNHYYDMCQAADAGINADSKVFHWKSADILSDKVIAAAKARMSKRQYMQEYEASFETASGRIYEDYSKANHTTETIKPHEQILWCHDQNYTPLSSACCVLRGKDLYILDEIVLTSAVSKQSALEFVDRYKNHANKTVVIYGDPSGQNGEKHGQSSDYTSMESVLKDNGWKFIRKVRAAHPSIKSRQNAVRAKIRNADDKISLYVNPAKAVYADKGLATCQLKEGSTFLEDDSDQYQHITTAIGYLTHFEFPVISAPSNKKRFYK